MLIESKVDINQARTDNGTGPLFSTVSGGHLEAMKILLEFKANIHQEGPIMMVLLHYI